MEETTKDKSAWCECPCCRGYKYGSHGWGHGHHFVRWILGLIILGIVFRLGVEIGEFRGEFWGGDDWGDYGHHRMMYPGTFNKMWQYPVAPPAPSSSQK